MSIALKGLNTEAPTQQVRQLFERHREGIYQQTDRIFAGLMVFQWAAAITAAFIFSPRTWDGAVSAVHIHVWTALVLGTLISGPPVVLAYLMPGKTVTRHVIASAQMLMSALLIHLTGGRIETHFHVFGSLAFLAFYRDWKVFIPATAIVAADHFFRGIYYPQSVYGVISESQWRWLEHAGWVIFEDFFLIAACVRGEREMWNIACQTARTNASEQRFRGLVENTGDLIAEINAEGVMVYLSPNLPGILGYEVEELRGQLAFDLVHQEEVGQTLEAFQAALVTREPQQVMFRYKNKGGAYVWMESRAKTYMTPEGVLRVVVICRDISEQRKAAEELKGAKEAAESASRAKSEFLANMSHEIRTPLNGVIGTLDLLLGSELSGQQTRYAQVGRASADALLALINDILDFSKIEAGQMEIDAHDFNVRRIFEDVTAMLGAKAAQKKLVLACFIHPNVQDQVRGDGDRLRQVLINLVNNAIKFTPKGDVTLRLTVEGQSGTHMTLRAEVSDSGIGIPPERMDRLFKSFSQVDASTTRKYGGTGLGLAISKRLVELMGGQISVVSEAGQGSTFAFTFQVEKGQVVEVKGPEVKEKGTKPAAKRGEIRVLLAEDNDVNQIVASEVLHHAGFVCDIVGNGREAVEAMRRAVYDVVLMDCQMPEMDGFEATRQIRRMEGVGELARKAATPIVALTASAIKGDREECLAAGMTSYLSKPLDAVLLVKTIESLVMRQGEQAVAAAAEAVRELCAEVATCGRGDDAKAAGKSDLQRPIAGE